MTLETKLKERKMHKHCGSLLGIFLPIPILFSLAVGASAQTKTPAPPAGMAQQEFTTLVDAISNAVVEKLKKEGTITQRPAEAAKTEVAGEPDIEDKASEQAAAFVARAELALTAFPELWRNLIRVPGRLDKSAAGGRSLVAFLLTLAAAMAAALGSEVLLRRALDGIRRRLAAA